MKMEVPEDVLAAIRAVVEWYRGSDGPDDIIWRDLPVIEAWLVGLGRLTDKQILEQFDEREQFDDGGEPYLF